MIMEVRDMGFATRQIHIGKESNDPYGALTPPIYLTSTFETGYEYDYSRVFNPTVALVERKIANLECGEAAIGTGSGIGAIATAFWSIINSGDEIVSSDTIYGCTHELFRVFESRFNIGVKFVDMKDEQEFRLTLSDKTKVVYIESPSNPTLTIIDIEKISKIAHEYNPQIKIFIDNTFCSPYIQNPIKLGADVVLHSATKYINGHGDALGGFVVSDKEFIDKCRFIGVNFMTGSHMSPLNAFLISRGLKTLDIRMEKHCSNAMQLAEYLIKQKKIKTVLYPGLKQHEGHEIAKKQMRLYGAVISIEIDASREKIYDALKSQIICTRAVSLGDAETLIEHPATMTHKLFSMQELEEAGISEGLIRISVGLENINDIIEDFDRLLKNL